MIGSVAKLLAGKHIENVTQQFEPEVGVLVSRQDPYYEYYEDHGRMKRRKRPIPPGLTKKEEKILRKIKKRAHHLDKGFRLCGVRFGWTFIIGLIPFAGDIADGLLSHHLIVKKAQQIDDVPEELIRKMTMNNSLSVAMGFIPLVGDVAVATFKTNSRNARLVEEFLVKRGQSNMGTTATNTATATGAAPPAGLRPTESTQASHAFGQADLDDSVPPPLPSRH